MQRAWAISAVPSPRREASRAAIFTTPFVDEMRNKQAVVETNLGTTS
jgi:hypothetical protein